MWYLLIFIVWYLVNVHGSRSHKTRLIRYDHTYRNVYKSGYYNGYKQAELDMERQYKAVANSDNNYYYFDETDLLPPGWDEYKRANWAANLQMYAHQDYGLDKKGCHITIHDGNGIHAQCYGKRRSTYYGNVNGDYKEIQGDKHGIDTAKNLYQKFWTEIGKPAKLQQGYKPGEAAKDAIYQAILKL
eukprot:156687_1